MHGKHVSQQIAATHVAVINQDGGHRLRYFYFDEAQRPVITNTTAHLYPGDREGHTEAVSQAHKQVDYGIAYTPVDSFTPDQWAALNPEKAARVV